MIFVGIDPGLGGAIAFIDEDGSLISVDDAPTLKVGSKNEYQIPIMVSLLRKNCINNVSGLVEARCAIEKVHAMPKQGVTSCFTFGRGLGLWEGILSALSIPYDLVLPQRWKKVMLDGMKKDKDSARLRAQQIFPNAELHLKKHEGRAEALLMAEYIRRLNNKSEE